MTERIQRPQDLPFPGVGKRTDGSYTYGGLFLDHITEEPSHFIFAYPNLYLVTDEGTILMTHGQYLDGYWSITVKVGADYLRRRS